MMGYKQTDIMKSILSPAAHIGNMQYLPGSRVGLVAPVNSVNMGSDNSLMAVAAIGLIIFLLIKK